MDMDGEWRMDFTIGQPGVEISERPEKEESEEESEEGEEEVEPLIGAVDITATAKLVSKENNGDLLYFRFEKVRGEQLLFRNFMKEAFANEKIYMLFDDE